jgi:hypothetical protein
MNKNKAAIEFLQKLGDAYRIGAINFPTGGSSKSSEASAILVRRLTPHFNETVQANLKNKPGVLGTVRQGRMAIVADAVYALNLLTKKTGMTVPKGAEDATVIEFVERYDAAVSFFDMAKDDRNGEAPKKMASAVLRYGSALLEAAQKVDVFADSETESNLMKASFRSAIQNMPTKVYDLRCNQNFESVLKKDLTAFEALDYNA